MSGIIDRELAAALRRSFQKSLPIVVTEGKVMSVDKASRTCDVKRDGLPNLIGVRLNAILEPGEDLITVFPKEGSNVLCIIIDNQPSESYLLTATNIGEISIKILNTSILINKDEIKINGGSLGGLVKARELKAQIDKNSDILNALINILKGSPIMEPGNGSASALQAALSTAIAGKETADLSDIENEKVKH